MQITSAMKMVSAAKLKRAQDKITQMRPYAEKLQEILENLSQSLDVSENAFGEIREEKNVLYVAITSNRGLCGGFNNNINKLALRLSREAIKNGKSAKVLGVGKKANDYFKNLEIENTGDELPQNAEEIWNNLDFSNAGDLAQKLMDLFTSGTYDKIVLIYNKFKNAAVQEVQEEPFLPIQMTASEGDSNAADYIFEPNKNEIVENLIPNSLRTQLYKALLDSNASEHGARMTAMHKATDNANELQKELKLSYNKARQAAITGEILEIVGGAEALNS